MSIIILQLAIILIAAKFCGSLFKRIGQPGVIGEIIAGIILGPSVLGAILPRVNEFVFPPYSLGTLQTLSQIGLILFMFIVGMELDFELFKKNSGSAVVISSANIIFPFGLGMILSYYLYTGYAPANVPFYAFSLFMGIAMSITAFPVLAHIIREKGLSNTKLGNLAISCAVLSDVVCWCLLAIILSFVKAGSIAATLLNLLLGILFVGVMFLVIKPLLKSLMIAKFKNGIIEPCVLAISFIILMISAYCSEMLGMHALFGAFIAGAIIPREGYFIKRLIYKIEDFTLIFLLPIFFVYTGLQINIVFVSNTIFWVTCLLIIIVAIAGKFGGSALASRLAGESVKDSLSLGALLNTRGLMELVVLNIGYELGLISLQLFTMMIIMALITTMMTGPIFNLINKGNIRNQGD